MELKKGTPHLEHAADAGQGDLQLIAPSRCAWRRRRCGGGPYGAAYTPLRRRLPLYVMKSCWKGEGEEKGEGVLTF